VSRLLSGLRVSLREVIVTPVLPQPGTSSCEAVVAGVSRAWNQNDGIEFAGYFTDDADLVNIHGMHVRGRQAIAGLYGVLFRSVFMDSRMACVVNARRDLCDGSAMLHVRSDVNVPYGSMAGEHRAQSTIVLKQQGNGWAIASLHNTLVAGAKM
jgi:uncharacterized protein (TIGR02246 family)